MMNKREVVWLIVRLFGVYFAYCAIAAMFSLVSSASALYSLSADTAASLKPEIENVRGVPGIPNNIPEAKPAVRADPAGDKAKSEAFKSILFYLLLTGLYGGGAFYLLKKGSWFYRILAKEHSAPRREERSVTTLKL